MKYTVVYSTTDQPDMVAYVLIIVPEDCQDPEKFAILKFSELFKRCFGNELNFIIRDIHPGYERKEPHKIEESESYENH